LNNTSSRFSCALLKLHITSMLPYLDKALVIDIDTLILQDLSDLWSRNVWNAMELSFPVKVKFPKFFYCLYFHICNIACTFMYSYIYVTILGHSSYKRNSK
jgi:hypothetical protein